MQSHNTVSLSTMGVEAPEVCLRAGRDWHRWQICRHEHL